MAPNRNRVQVFQIDHGAVLAGMVSGASSSLVCYEEPHFALGDTSSQICSSTQINKTRPAVVEGIEPRLIVGRRPSGRRNSNLLSPNGGRRGTNTRRIGVKQRKRAAPSTPVVGANNKNSNKMRIVPVKNALKKPHVHVGKRGWPYPSTASHGTHPA